MSSAVLTLRISTEVKERLDQLAASTSRSKSFLAAEAIERYLDLESWQIGEINDALREADAGDFATESEVAAIAAKYAG